MSYCRVQNKFWGRSSNGIVWIGGFTKSGLLAGQGQMPSVHPNQEYRQCHWGHAESAPQHFKPYKKRKCLAETTVEIAGQIVRLIVLEVERISVL